MCLVSPSGKAIRNENNTQRYNFSLGFRFKYAINFAGLSEEGVIVP